MTLLWRLRFPAPSNRLKSNFFNQLAERIVNVAIGRGLITRNPKSEIRFFEVLDGALIGTLGLGRSGAKQPFTTT